MISHVEATTNKIEPEICKTTMKQFNEITKTNHAGNLENNIKNDKTKSNNILNEKYYNSFMIFKMLLIVYLIVQLIHFL